MNLATLQRHVARAVMTPLSPSDRMRRIALDGRSLASVANKIIKPNDRLTSFERLEIYNRQYWFRVLDAFSDDFPGLRAVLGDRRFDALAKHYLTDCPSRSFTMRDLGSHLEVLAPQTSALRPRPSTNLPSTWFVSNGRKSKRSTAPLNLRLPQPSLAGVDPAKLRLRLQPYIRLLDLHFPVDDLLLAVKHDAPADIASNAMEERQKRKKVSAVARLKPAPVFLAIHRLENTVYFRRLEREEFTILQSLQTTAAPSNAPLSPPSAPVKIPAARARSLRSLVVPELVLPGLVHRVTQNAFPSPMECGGAQRRLPPGCFPAVASFLGGPHAAVACCVGPWVQQT